MKISRMLAGGQVPGGPHVAIYATAPGPGQFATLMTVEPDAGHDLAACEVAAEAMACALSAEDIAGAYVVERVSAAPRRERIRAAEFRAGGKAIRSRP
jgi:hypothetical protein